MSIGGQASSLFRPVGLQLAEKRLFRGERGSGLAGTRTQDQCLKRALLYQLSYQPVGIEGTFK